MALRATGKRAIQNGIDGLIDFKNGNVSGQAYVNWSEVYKGRLESDDYVIADGDLDRKIYVIKSYQTPIAWCFVRDGKTHDWTIVQRTFSPTTSGHISVVRVATQHTGFYA